MRRLLIPALLLLAALPATASSTVMTGLGYGALDAPRNIDPLKLGQLFCAGRIAGDMSAVEPYYAPKLIRAVASAAAIPWQTYPDQPTSCEAYIVNGYDNTIGVLVELRYASAAHRWADTLNLERTPDSWLLNNVFYESGGNLRFRIVEQVQ